MIRFEEAQFSFGGKRILDGVSELIPEGARAGLIGRNGAGKTTLFRLILGELELESGSISVPRERRIAFLPQHPALPPEETVLRHVLESHPVLRDIEDQLIRLERKMEAEPDPDRLDRLVERHRALSRDFEARGGFDLEAKVTGVLEGLGFSRRDLLRETGLLSPGEKNRVAVAKVLLAEADVLLLDEPTNHLDFDMVEWFEDFLRDPPPVESGTRPTLLVASHDRYFLNRFADRIYELRDGSLHGYRGDYDAFSRQRVEEMDRQEKEYRLREAEVARDLEFIRRNFAAQKARQAKSREKKLSRMERLERPDRGPGGPRIRFRETAKAGDDVIRLEGVHCGYEGKVIIRDVFLEIERGEKVAIVGPNGSGKTTLLKCMVGVIPPIAGSVRPGQRAVIGYYEQELARIGSGKTVFEEVHDLVPRWNDQEVHDLLAAFLFRGDEVLLRTETLSGGEKARIALIRLLLSGANLLILDEPTNHLDIHARAALEESLAAFPETIVFVSHDRYFVERLAERLLALHEGVLREFPGGYQEYREFRWAERAREAAARASSKGRRGRMASSAPAGARPGKSEEERLVKAISLVEEELRGKQQACGLEEHYRNPDAMRRLKQEIAGLEDRLEELYRKWEAELGR